MSMFASNMHEQVMRSDRDIAIRSWHGRRERERSRGRDGESRERRRQGEGERGREGERVGRR